jgi:hypothetical protein
VDDWLGVAALNYRAESTRCTALSSSGKFCDRESLPDAPYPICLEHAARLLRYLNSYLPHPDDRVGRILLAARDFDVNHAAPRKSATAGRGVVYYLRVGDKIKIGYTADLRQRMNTYPPDSVLLACEPGDLNLEQRRHTQFVKHRKVAREWFAPAPELMSHIDSVRAEHDLRQFLPPKRSPTRPVDKYGRPIY